MNEITFEGIGTQWSVQIDDEPLTSLDLITQQILAMVEEFDHRYSRFIPDSAFSQINALDTPSVPVSAELAALLVFGWRLKQLSSGAFDPNLGDVFAAYGYDQTYSFQLDHQKLALANQQRATWSIKNQTLFKSGPTALDIGAWGKGALVDKLARHLQTLKIDHFLVNGSGDIYATQKHTGRGWKAALEHPTNPQKAIGTVWINQGALASSSPYRRQVGTFHHLLNGNTHQPVRGVAATYVQAKTAMVADGLATALFVSNPVHWQPIRQAFPCEYLVIKESGEVIKSDHFEAELYL